LFNLFDLWGAVVTSRPEIKTLKDLEGKQLAAARATTNFVMFEFFSKQAGVDGKKLEGLNTPKAGLDGYGSRHRPDGVRERGAGQQEEQGEEARDQQPGPAHRGKLEGVRARRLHPISRRRGAHRLDRAEPGAGGAALRHLQAGSRMDREEPGRGSAPDRAEID